MSSRSTDSRLEARIAFAIVVALAAAWNCWFDTAVNRPRGTTECGISIRSGSPLGQSFTARILTS
jgi:hypothetical protein